MGLAYLPTLGVAASGVNVGLYASPIVRAIGSIGFRVLLWGSPVVKGFWSEQANSESSKTSALGVLTQTRPKRGWLELAEEESSSLYQRVGGRLFYSS